MQRINIAPVVDSEQRLLGEISCPLLFTLGIPDFFQQLRSTSFIRDFDPFERYFSEEAKSTVGGVMEREVCTLPPSATLMEIIYELAVKNHPKVYIIDNGKLTGIIDQALVLERIVNF